MSVWVAVMLAGSVLPGYTRGSWADLSEADSVCDDVLGDLREALMADVRAFEEQS